jgi:hypothetical protein
MGGWVGLRNEWMGGRGVGEVWARCGLFMRLMKCKKKEKNMLSFTSPDFFLNKKSVMK